MTDETVSVPRHAGFIKNNLRDYGMLLSLFAIMLFFQAVTDGTLLQPLNLTNLVLQNSYIIIMALGMLLVIVAGHIDLSVGSVVGFIGALAAVLMAVGRQPYRPRFDSLERIFDQITGGRLGGGATLHGCRIRPLSRKAKDILPFDLAVEPESPRKTGGSVIRKDR